jgi:tRNA (cytidine32/uridine32-2'-O)-methyltransferase
MSNTDLLANIRIVLVNTSHPGNIGSAARAIKTMGLEQLYLVNPRFFPDKEASVLASQATDILEKAVVVNTLAEAIHDCSLVVGTSPNVRTLPWALMTAREAAPVVVKEAQQQSVAIVFGSEKYGLSNEELRCCQYQVEIPTNPVYNSLNLAAAVQVICYEIRMAWLSLLPLAGEGGRRADEGGEEAEKFSTTDELERFYEHLNQTLHQVGFLQTHVPNQVMERLRRLYARTRVEVKELNILRGMLSAIQKKL